MHDEDDHSYHHQKMDQSAGDVKGQPPQNPQNNQHHGDQQEHGLLGKVASAVLSCMEDQTIVRIAKLFSRKKLTELGGLVQVDSAALVSVAIGELAVAGKNFCSGQPAQRAVLRQYSTPVLTISAWNSL